MKKMIAALVALAGMSGAARAAVDTTVSWEVSLTGAAGSWSSSVDVSSPNTQVYMRARVAYIPGSDGSSVTPVGLASLIFQPTASNATSGDTVLPFVNGGLGSNTSSPVGVIDPTTQLNDATSFGRVSPWGRVQLSSTVALKGFFHTNPNGDGINYLRIAQSIASAWIGQPGNTSGGSGVSIAQLSNVGRTSSDPAFWPGLGTGDASNPLIYAFKFGIQLDSTPISSRVGHDMVIDAPTNGFGNLLVGLRQVIWWGSYIETSGSIRGTPEVNTATVHFTVPAPSGAAILGLGGVLARRRRR
jgi:hypothetical protein